jgi:CBS-domain-containing membrane protein
VPHARMEDIDRLLIAMATSQKGIDFHVPGMPPVNIVVLMLTPADDPGLHLQVFAALAKDFMKPQVVQEVASLANPKAVLNYFTTTKVEIPQFLRARDVMKRHPVTLLENNTLNEAIEVFATKNLDEIPVIDDVHELRGVVSLSDLLKFSLPEHILWLDDLSSVYRFQPFSEVLRTADETKVADFMREEFITVHEDVPAVQLAKLFLVHKLSKLLVVNDAGKLAGVVDLKDFSAKLFWE